MTSSQEQVAGPLGHTTPQTSMHTAGHTAPSPSRAASTRQHDATGRPAWRALLLLSAGHVCNDLNQGAVPALLPFLLVPFGLSYTDAGILTLAATITSSLIQPLFGHLSDRRPLPWLMPLGIALGGVALGMVGLVPPRMGLSFALLIMCVALSGLGVAAFHPDGARYANYVSGRKRGGGMSVFAVGGNLGFALGPALVTLGLGLSGLHGTLWLLVPAALMASVLFRALPMLSAFRPVRSTPAPQAEATAQSAEAANHAAPVADDEHVAEAWGPFAVLTGVIGLRSIAYFGLLSFAPLYAISALGSSKATAEFALTAMLVVAAGGTLCTGWLSDRVGRRLAIVAPLALATPFLLAFAATGGSHGSLAALGFLALVLGGTGIVAPFNVMVVLGQEYLPGRLGVAGGITMGFGIGLGGLGAAIFGAVADHAGLGTTLAIIGLLPVVAALLALFALPLPRSEARVAHAN